MTVPTNTKQTYSTGGIREDLQNVIYNISSTDTPFIKAIPQDKAGATTTEWQTDTLAAAATNRAIEGDNPTAKAASPTTRVSNQQQISQKTIITSGTARAVDTAGRSDQHAYDLMKAGKELMRDMEFALTQNQAASAGGTGTARSLASLESWLSTNKTTAGTSVSGATTPGASGSPASPTTAPTDASSTGTFTKADLDAVIQGCWTQGGSPTMIMVGAGAKSTLSGFSGISTLQTQANANQNVTLVGGVDFYKSDFATLKVVPNRFQRNRTAFVLDLDYWSVAYLRRMMRQKLAKTGDADQEQVIVEYTLRAKNEASSGKVTDIT